MKDTVFAIIGAAVLVACNIYVPIAASRGDGLGAAVALCGAIGAGFWTGWHASGARDYWRTLRRREAGR